MGLSSNLETRRVFVLSISDSIEVNHAIFLEARPRLPLIYDSAEKYFMKFRSHGLLHICCPSPNKNEYAHFDDFHEFQAIREDRQSRARPVTAEQGQGKQKESRGDKRSIKKRKEKTELKILEGTRIHRLITE